jgi:hypothetical protein
MCLKPLQRIGLLVLGITALGAGVTASLKDWSAAGVVSLILPGLLVIIFAIVGVFPNVHLKEGNIDWPKIEEPKPVEPVPDPHRAEIAELREHLAEVSTRLGNYILANEPAPDDGMTDEERLTQLREGLQELESDVNYRLFTGEDYEDGISTEDLHKTRDKTREELDREERRQQAQFDFGMRDKPPDPQL